MNPPEEATPKLPHPCFCIEWDDMGFGKIQDTPSETSVPGWGTRGMNKMAEQIAQLRRQVAEGGGRAGTR